MRTTLDIDEPVLRDLRKLRKLEGKTMGRLVSDLTAWALHTDAAGKSRARPFHWMTKDMGARVNLADRDALYDAMEQPARRSTR